MANPPNIDVFKGKEASVNSYLFEDETSMIAIDVLRNSAEALELAKWLKSKDKTLTYIVVTHGHPDHYIGLDVMHKEFPQAKIIVASEGVKQDIIGFSTWMESIGWLDGEPNMKPKTPANPKGFDYDQIIEVLEEDTLALEGGSVLELFTEYQPAEAEHLTTLYNKDLNALLTADFVYNGVHLWLGNGVDQQHIDNWKSQLERFKATFSANNPLVVLYPGHGEKGGLELIDRVLQYIQDFETTVAEVNNKTAAMDKMKAKYPTWEQADFLLFHSVDFHVSE